MKAPVFATSVLLAAISPLAVSHPGHGMVAHSDTLLHPFLGSEHVLLFAAIGGVAWLLGQRMWRGNRRDEE